MRIYVGVPIIVNAGDSLAIGFVGVEVHGLGFILAVAAVECKTNCQAEARSGRGKRDKHKTKPTRPCARPRRSQAPKQKMSGANTTLGPGVCAGALRACWVCSCLSRLPLPHSVIGFGLGWSSSQWPRAVSDSR